MTEHSAPPGTALITGASSGIGAAFAERLARDQYNLILVARRREQLEALAKELRATRHITAEVLPADLTRAEDLSRVEQRVMASGDLTLLVNNAGAGAYKPFVNLEAELAEALIRLQVVAVTRLCRAALPGMISRQQGAIINVSSRLAFSGALPSPPLPKRAVYAASKAFVNVFTQLLHDELRGTGVHVQALCPGLVRTAFHASMGVDPDSFPQHAVMTPENVVAASLAGLRAGEVICIPALDDPACIATLQKSEKELLAHSGSGMPASRYLAP